MLIADVHQCVSSIAQNHPTGPGLRKIDRVVVAVWKGEGCIQHMYAVAACVNTDIDAQALT